MDDFWTSFESAMGGGTPQQQIGQAVSGAITPQGMAQPQAPMNPNAFMTQDQLQRLYNQGAAESGLMQLANAFRPPSPVVQFPGAPYRGGPIGPNTSAGQMALMQLMQSIANVGGSR